MEKQSFTVTVAEKTTHKIVFENSGEWKGTIDGKEFSCDVIHPEKNHFHVIRDAHFNGVGMRITDNVKMIFFV